MNIALDCLNDTISLAKGLEDSYEWKHGPAGGFPADAETLTKILGFVRAIVLHHSDGWAAKFIEKDSVLDHCRKQILWADKMIRAIGGRIGLADFANQLRADADSIAVSFIRFLASTPSSSVDVNGVTYRNFLLQGTSADGFQQFLPLAQKAKKQVEAAEKLKQWLLEAYGNEASQSLKEAQQSLETEILKAEQNKWFPDCLVESDGGNQTLDDAIKVFMDFSHPKVGGVGSDFIDRIARNILKSNPDPFTVPRSARKKAHDLIKDAMARNVTHDKVPLLNLDESALKRERRALAALFGETESHKVDVDRFLHLIQVDPAQLRSWALELAGFLQDNVMLPDLPTDLTNFLDAYKGVKIFYTYGDSPSIEDMLDRFEKGLFKDVRQKDWKQIGMLTGSCSVALLQTFRQKMKDRDLLDRKMNILRMMSVQNRELTRTVDILDEIQPYLFKMVTADADGVVQSVRDLLKSGVLNRADREKISVSQLGGLFFLVDDGSELAERNAKLVQSASIVIDVEKLVDHASDAFSLNSPSDFVRLETADKSGETTKFRLAGGRTDWKVAGYSGIESFFMEMRISARSSRREGPRQRDSVSHSDGDYSHNNKVMDEVLTRVRKVFDLARHLFHASRLGDDISSARAEFEAQAPKKKNKYDDAPGRDRIEKEVEKWSLRREVLRANFESARDSFPFISFVYPRDVTRRKVCADFSLRRAVPVRNPGWSCTIQLCHSCDVVTTSPPCYLPA